MITPLDLPITAAVDALERALRDGLDPEADPPRTRVPLPNGELLVMPSETTVKVVSVGGDPRVQGLVIHFDPETLAPVALFDGIALTNLRTSAVSALAVRHLAAPDAARLLVFGRGPQAQAHIDAVKAVRPITHVERAGRGDTPAVERADIICCCTTATTPLFDGAGVADHACVVAIGSHEPDATELDPALVRRSTVVVESRASALREAGDVIAAGLTADDLTTLGEVVLGAPLGPGPRVFKSTGMSWEDAVIARAAVAQ